MAPALTMPGMDLCAKQARGRVTLVPTAASDPCGGLYMQRVRSDQLTVKATPEAWCPPLYVGLPLTAQSSTGVRIAAMLCGTALSGCVRL